ncbi:MAG: ArsA-related P-loop ATPase [Myxococcota bacterium]|nr:ArsA-related P-loop ATPase [Myxococcota bacterium]
MSNLPRGIDLRGELMQRRLLVCVGSGGVGKTTVAAALAVEAARLGRRTLVITIDPARRLANSLGLEVLGNTETRIPDEKWASVGIKPAGSLHAMMLDTRSTFDELIRRVSPNDATRARVLNNRAYQHINNTLVNTRDYMAAEKLYDVYTRGDYDLIVLDTPPMKNAIDFIESGSLLTRFLDEKIMRWFLTPYDESRVFGRRMMLGTSAIAFRLLGSIFGREFLDELSEFFLAFKDLYRGFRERSERVAALMADVDETRFAIVCSPRPTSIEEARFFHEQLTSRDINASVFIVNQVGRYANRYPHADRRFLGDTEREWLADRLEGADPGHVDQLCDRLEANFREAYQASLSDQDTVETLRSWVGRDQTFRTVPRFIDEVMDFEGLLEIAARVFESDTQVSAADG